MLIFNRRIKRGNFCLSLSDRNCAVDTQLNIFEKLSFMLVPRIICWWIAAAAAAWCGLNLPPSACLASGCSWCFGAGGVGADCGACGTCGGGAGGVATLLVGVAAFGIGLGVGGSGLGHAAWASLCSISCSCCSAFTKAVFSLKTNQIDPSNPQNNELLTCSKCIPIGMFSFERLFNISRNTVFTNNTWIPSCGRSLEGSVLTPRTIFFTATSWLLPLPNWREVRFALRALERFGRRWDRRLFRYEIHHVLQTNQIDELRVRRIRNKVHLRRRWLRWRDLQ